MYLFLEGGKGRERNINMRLPLVRPLVEMRGCALQPRLVPCLGIAPETFWFTDQRSIHRATLARAQ